MRGYHYAVISLGFPVADYYSMRGRAVVGLEINTFEERRAIYNRARAAQSYTLGRRAVFGGTDFARRNPPRPKFVHSFSDASRIKSGVAPADFVTTAAWLLGPNALDQDQSLHIVTVTALQSQRRSVDNAGRSVNCNMREMDIQ